MLKFSITLFVKTENKTKFRTFINIWYPPKNSEIYWTSSNDLQIIIIY